MENKFFWKKIFWEKFDKRAMSISIVLLVIMVIVTIGICLAYFILYTIGTGNTIHISDSIDSIYVRENYLNFYINDIFEKSTQNFKISDGKAKFIENFKNNLNGYKDVNGNYVVSDLGQVEAQVNEGNVNLDNNMISISLNLVLIGVNENGVVVKYGYNYLIQKDFATGVIKSDLTENTGLIPKKDNMNTAANNAVNPVNVNPTSQNLEGVLEFQDGTSEANIYYNYTNKWYWSFQYNVNPIYITWHSAELDPKSWGMNLKNQDFIKSLRNKNCDEGLKLLISRALKNDEGGMFSNTGIIYNYDGKSSGVDISSEGIDCSNIINHLKS